MGPGEHITADDRERFQLMRELGCVVSSVYCGKPGTPGQVRPLVAGGRRMGHQATICLHPWYHQGQPPAVRYAGAIVQLTADQATTRYGPSLALDRPAFEHRFGTELELLEMQDALIEAYRRAEAWVA